MTNPFRKFGVRVTAAIILSILTVVILSDILIYQFTYQAQLEGTRQELKGIAQTAVLLIDPAQVAQVPLNKDGVNTQAYNYLNDQLKKIRSTNLKIRFIYILEKVDNTNMWRFVVDPEPDGKDGKRTYPGDLYDAGRFPELLNGFEQPSADKKIETDEWGSTLSGYTPIRDSVGRPMAVLGVDISADDIYAMRREVMRRVLIILVLGVILAFAVGFLISNRVTDPVEQLITGTRYIADGHLHHQVHVGGDDEISQLARSFNEMSTSLQDSRQKLLSYFYDTVNALVMLLEVRDHYTLGHSESVANYSVKIAEKMGIDAKTVEMFKRVALLHDIGKVGVRDSILHKPDKLNDQEWESIKQHPILGEQILKPLLEDPVMLSVIRNHHERYDGKGYPDGLTREQIPLLVAIVTVADSYDAMTSSRAYRGAMSKEEAIDQLKKNRGQQFHPDVVDTFLQILKEQDKA